LKKSSLHTVAQGYKPEAGDNIVSFFDKDRHGKSRIRFIYLQALIFLHHTFADRIISTFRINYFKVKFLCLVVLLLSMSNTSFAQIQIEGYIRDQRTKEPIDNVMVISSPSNNIAYSVFNGYFSIIILNSMERLVFYNSDYIPTIMDVNLIQMRDTIGLINRIDYYDHHLPDRTTNPAFKMQEIKGEVVSGKNFPIDTKNCKILTIDLPYNSNVIDSLYAIDITGQDIYNFREVNRKTTLSLVAWQKNTFFKTIDIDISGLKWRETNVLEYNFDINPDKDLIDSAKLIYPVYLAWKQEREELKGDHSMKFEHFIEENRRRIGFILDSISTIEIARRNHLQDSLVKLAGEMEVKIIDSLKKEQEKDRVRIIDSLIKEQEKDRVRIIDSLKKEQEKHKDIYDNEEKAFRSRSYKKILFTPNGLIINSSPNNNLKGISFIGLESDLGLLSNLTDDLLFFAYFYLPQIQYSKFTPEWFIGFIPGKFNIGRTFTTYAGIGFGQGSANYEKSNVNQLLFNLSLSAKVYDSNYFQVDLFSQISNRVTLKKISQPNFITQWNVVGLGITF